MRKWFSEVKTIFSSPQNELSNVNKNYIDISNEQKFKLWEEYKNGPSRHLGAKFRLGKSRIQLIHIDLYIVFDSYSLCRILKWKRQFQFHTYELIVLQKKAYADILSHLFPIFFMRHCDCNPLQIDLYLSFHIFKWNWILYVCISFGNLKFETFKRSFKLQSENVSTRNNIRLSTTISALLFGRDFGQP